MAKGTQKVKGLTPEELAGLSESARKQIEEQLAAAEPAKSVKDTEELVTVNPSTKKIKRVKSEEVGKTTLRNLAKALGYSGVSGSSKLLDTILSGSVKGPTTDVGARKQQASLQNSIDQIDNNAKLLAMIGDEQKRTNELLTQLLKYISEQNEDEDGKGGNLPSIGPIGKPGERKGPSQHLVDKRNRLLRRRSVGTAFVAGAGVAAGAGTAAVVGSMVGGSTTAEPAAAPPPAMSTITPQTQQQNTVPVGSSENVGSVLNRMGETPGGMASVASQQAGKSAEQIQEYLRTGGVALDPKRDNWCAAFVNSTLKQSNVPGSGSMIANSFQRWGSAVDPKDVKPGDVVLQTRGKGPNETGGHVGIATGRMVDNKVEMIAGNSGQGGPSQTSVMTYFVPVNEQLMVRRATATREDKNVGEQAATLAASQTNQAQMSQQQPSSGAAAMAASTRAEVANRQPMQVQVVDATQSGGPENATLGSGHNVIDPQDPGLVEPEDAAERYEKLFAEAA